MQKQKLESKDRLLTSRLGVLHPFADLGGEALDERVDLVTHGHWVLDYLHGIHQRGTAGRGQL